MNILIHLLLVLCLPLGLVQDEAADKEKAFQEVKEGTFTDMVKITGKFMPHEAVELGFEPEGYKGQLKIEKVYEPGSFVHKGEVLIHFDMEAIDEQIENTRLDLKSAGQKFEDAVAQRRSTAMDMEAERESAEMEYALSEESLKGYKEIGIPLDKDRADLSKMYSKHSIDDQTDELDQLGQMYKEDELTEETEELVLKRSKRNLDRSKFSFDIQKRQHQYNEDFSKKAQLKRMIQGVQAKKRALEKILIRGDSRIVHADIAVTRARRNVEKIQKNLNRLTTDREKMFIESPMDGLLLHGSKKLEGQTLKEGKTATPGKALFTVAKPGFLVFGFVAPEKEILYLEKGMTLLVRPAAMPGTVLEAELDSIAKLPSPQKKGFECTAKVKGNHPELLPGMTGDVFINYEFDNVLTVPKEALKEEKGRHYVEMETESGVEKKFVTTGRSNEKETIIKEGLEKGDRVQVPAPKTKVPPAGKDEKSAGADVKEKLKALGYVGGKKEKVP